MTEERADLLIELGTEELPPIVLKQLVETLPAEIAAGFDQAGIAYDDIRGVGSPRRVGVIATAVAGAQPDRRVEHKGPALRVAYDAENRPTRAAEGFARSCGVAVESLERLRTDKGEWLAYRGVEHGRNLAELLPGILQGAVDRLPLPKRMRWGNGDAAFIRPVHWLVVLYGNAVIPCELFGITAGRETRGHRFHHPELIPLGGPGDYVAALRQPGRVLVDFDERREAVRQQVRACGAGLSGKTELDPELLDEVTALVEWPVALAGSFDEDFLRVPSEALVSSMKGHQKYFPVRDEDGRLMPGFVAVANIESREPRQVVAGNERVIRPRLADAAFFWDQDRRRRLDSRIDDLAGIVFQTALGTLHDKSRRIARLAAALAESFGAEPEVAERAAWLSKTDLLTEMVGEFPELQGVMGRYYAGEDGEGEDVATALDEAYWPRFAGDRIPRTPTGRTVALADRLDTLVGIFGIGKPPTGAKDPFGLRRAALGILRIGIEGGRHVNLFDAIERAIDTLREQNIALKPDTREEVYAFLLDRLRPYTLERGVAYDSIEAVIASRPASALDFERRVQAVETFRQRPEAESLAATNKRIRNILRKSGEDAPSPHVAEVLLVVPAERCLFEALQQAESEVGPLVAAGDYGTALDSLAGLRPTVDAFFDDVMVMDEDEPTRRNRLALLDRLSRSFLEVADISLLQG